MTYKRGFWFAILVICLGLLAAGLAIQKLGGWRYTAHRLHTIEAWPTYTQRKSQLDLLSIDSAAIIFLGDSHVAFGQWDELLPAHSIYNRGIPGEGIEGLTAYAKTLPLNTAKLIIVQIGTNDLLFHEPDEVLNMYRKSLEEVFFNVPAKVILCTLPGVNNGVRWTGVREQDVALLNEGIRDFPASDKLVILDLSDLLDTKQGLLPQELTHDGVHLTGPAYRLWADGLQDVLVMKNIPEIE